MRSRPIKKQKRVRAVKVPVGRVSSWAITDVGLKREDNEDSLLVDSNLNLFVVADGMGGHAGGGTASRMAVETIRARILQARRDQALFDRRATDKESERILQKLDDTIRQASSEIFDASNLSPELAGMGTTLTLLLVHGSRGYVAHVGDSRLYRLRDDVLTQLTEDHSLVNEQVKAGFITAEEAAHSRFRNIITRSVGFENQVSPDTFSIPLRPDDVFLLCSDGLSGMVDDPVIARTMQSGRLSDAASRLVALAKKGGGEDNITLIIVRFNPQTAKKPKVRARRAAPVTAGRPAAH
jgi:protein phosphatase